MKLSVIVAAVLVLAVAAVSAQAYEGLAADYKSCTNDSGKVANNEVVSACTRLIDNAKKKNELVGYFHALRASVNTDKQLNCQDAKAAFQLLGSDKLKKFARQLAEANC